MTEYCLDVLITHKPEAGELDQILASQAVTDRFHIHFIHHGTGPGGRTLRRITTPVASELEAYLRRVLAVQHTYEVLYF